jgi:hypothetical protein
MGLRAGKLEVFLAKNRKESCWLLKLELLEMLSVNMSQVQLKVDIQLCLRVNMIQVQFFIEENHHCHDMCFFFAHLLDHEIFLLKSCIKSSVLVLQLLP